MAQRSGTPAQYKQMRTLRDKLQKLVPLKTKAARAATATASGAKLKHNDRLSAAQPRKRRHSVVLCLPTFHRRY